MRRVRVNLKRRSYDILIGRGALKSLGKELRKLKLGDAAYIITDPLVKQKHGRSIEKALKLSGFALRFKIVPASERSKSLSVAAAVIRDIAGYDRKKKLFIVALGGGVVGDLAGFIASIYKRGIPYLQVPTTLLAQVDSSIGGKTGVDLLQGKNLVGSFYQPKLVVSDTYLLKTLNPRQVKAGIAEIIKYAAIKDARLLGFLRKNRKKILKLETRSLEYIIWRSASIKAAIVSLDEREKKGIRTILNFGHTIGHAIEAAGGYRRYNHGEAVALGMLAACRISKRLKIAKGKAVEKIEEAVKAFGLPLSIEKINPKDIISAHYRDKKFSGAKNKFVLLKDIGKTAICKGIPLEIIEEAIKTG